VVATLSVLRPEKDHGTFLKAVASLSGDWPGVTFAVLGDGPERERLESLAVALGLGGRVVFGGWIPDTAVALRAVDVVVFSSKPVVETAPLAGLEAMATGVPVVASDVGALREQIENGRTGYLVPTGDSEALAAKISALLADDALRAEMGVRSREAVEDKYRLDENVASSAALLERLARGKGMAH
jgi:glycosyltransferase involved in cell wall biosynthesis